MKLRITVSCGQKTKGENNGKMKKKWNKKTKNKQIIITKYNPLPPQQSKNAYYE